MGKLLGTMLGKVFAWLTGKFLGEVAVSAVVTLAMAGMFARPASNAETPLPPPSLPLLATAATVDPTAHWLDLPLDREPTASLPETAALRPQPSRLHRGADAGKQQATMARDDIPLPPPRPVLAMPTAPKLQLLLQAKLVTPTFASPNASFCATSSADDEGSCPTGLIADAGANADAPPRPMALIPAARSAALETRRDTTLFGIAAGDLLPLPRHVLTGMTSVRQTLAGLTSGFR